MWEHEGTQYRDIDEEQLVQQLAWFTGVYFTANPERGVHNPQLHAVIRQRQHMWRGWVAFIGGHAHNWLMEDNRGQQLGLVGWERCQHLTELGQKVLGLGYEVGLTAHEKAIFCPDDETYNVMENTLYPRPQFAGADTPF